MVRSGRLLSSARVELPLKQISDLRPGPERNPTLRIALAAGLWLALFALLFTAGASMDLWPRFPAGALRGTDLLAGLLFGVLLLLVLLRRRRP